MAENPYQSTEAEDIVPSGKRPALTPAGVILVLIAVAIIAFFLVPGVR